MDYISRQLSQTSESISKTLHPDQRPESGSFIPAAPTSPRGDVHAEKLPPVRFHCFGAASDPDLEQGDVADCDRRENKRDPGSVTIDLLSPPHSSTEKLASSPGADVKDGNTDKAPCPEPPCDGVTPAVAASAHQGRKVSAGTDPTIGSVGAPLPSDESTPPADSASCGKADDAKHSISWQIAGTEPRWRASIANGHYTTLGQFVDYLSRQPRHMRLDCGGGFDLLDLSFGPSSLSKLGSSQRSRIVRTVVLDDEACAGMLSAYSDRIHGCETGADFNVVWLAGAPTWAGRLLDVLGPLAKARPDAAMCAEDRALLLTGTIVFDRDPDTLFSCTRLNPHWIAHQGGSSEPKHGEDDIDAAPASGAPPRSADDWVPLSASMRDALDLAQRCLAADLPASQVLAMLRRAASAEPSLPMVCLPKDLASDGVRTRSDGSTNILKCLAWTINHLGGPQESSKRLKFLAKRLADDLVTHDPKA